MILNFEGDLWYWRGPAPWHFITVPEAACDDIHAVSGTVTYGWGMIPCDVTIGSTTWYTALWPKDGAYIVPVKAWVRKAEGLELGDAASVTLDV